MTEKERLLHTLFARNDGTEHLNIKFFRGTAKDISPEDLCRQVNSALLQNELGSIEARAEFGDRGRTKIDVKARWGT